MFSNVNDITFKYKVFGEKWGILRTDVLLDLANKIDVPEDVRYIGESYLWTQIAKNFKTLFVNKVLRIYYRGTADTLSSRNIAGKYPLGAYITEKMVLKCSYKYILHTPKKLIISCTKLSYSSLLSGKGLFETMSGMPMFLKCLIILTRPLGYIAKIKYPAQKK